MKFYRKIGGPAVPPGLEGLQGPAKPPGLGGPAVPPGLEGLQGPAKPPGHGERSRSHVLLLEGVFNDVHLCIEAFLLMCTI